MSNVTPPQRVGAATPGAPHPGPLLISLNKAAKLLGCTRTQLKALAIDGMIVTVKVGAVTKYNVASIEAYSRGDIQHRVWDRRGIASVIAQGRAKVLPKRTAA